MAGKIRRKIKDKKNVKKLDKYTPKVKKERPPRDTEDFVKTLARHKFDIMVRVVIVIIVLALATVFFYVRNIFKVYDGYQVINSVEMDISAKSKIKQFGTELLVYNNDGIRCVDGKGKVVWDATYEMQNPVVETCGDMVAVADYNGSNIYVFNRQGPLHSIDTGMPVKKFQVSGKGQVVAVLEDTNYTPIHLYNSEGADRAVFKTSMHDSGYPLDVAISDNGEIVAVSYLYIDSGSFKTNVAYYNFGEVGKNETDNLISGYTYTGAVVPDVEFVGADKAVAIADNRLMFYRGSQRPESTGDVLVQDQMYSVYFGEQYVALVFLNTESDERFKVEIYDGSGTKKDTVYFADEIDNIFFDKDRVVIYNADNCLIHKIGGIDKFNNSFNRSILAMMPTNVNNRFVIVTNDCVETIELH